MSFTYRSSFSLYFCLTACALSGSVVDNGPPAEDVCKSNQDPLPAECLKDNGSKKINVAATNTEENPNPPASDCSFASVKEQHSSASKQGDFSGLIAKEYQDTSLAGPANLRVTIFAKTDPSVSSAENPPTIKVTSLGCEAHETVTLAQYDKKEFYNVFYINKKNPTSALSPFVRSEAYTIEAKYSNGLSVQKTIQVPADFSIQAPSKVDGNYTAAIKWTPPSKPEETITWILPLSSAQEQGFQPTQWWMGWPADPFYVKTETGSSSIKYNYTSSTFVIDQINKRFWAVAVRIRISQWNALERKENQSPTIVIPGLVQQYETEKSNGATNKTLSEYVSVLVKSGLFRDLYPLIDKNVDTGLWVSATYARPALMELP